MQNGSLLSFNIQRRFAAEHIASWPTIKLEQRSVVDVNQKVSLLFRENHEALTKCKMRVDVNYIVLELRE